MATKDDLIALLARSHQGAAHGASAEALARALDTPERRVRMLVTEAREEGVAIAATPEHGYFIAVLPDEIDLCCKFLRARALKSLLLESRLRNIPLPELLGQMRLPS
jgi:biotin operon repressor